MPALQGRRSPLQRHPRFVFHFTPTSCSWLNAVEGFFAKLSRRRLKRGVFCSIADICPTNSGNRTNSCLVGLLPRLIALQKLASCMGTSMR